MSTIVLKYVLTLSILLGTQISLAQNVYERKIDSLQFTTNVASSCRSTNVLEECELCSSCGDVFFWEIIQGKDSVIPLLLDKIMDSTLSYAPNNYAAMQFRVGDIALLAFQEIIHHIPTLTLAGIEFSSTEAYSVFWKHLNHSYENRVHFVTALKQWHMANKENFIWVSSNAFEICDCSGPHPNGGHYALKKD
ncbi:hypothetical protein SAMN05216474_1885 [Lishizhenia tianjinensis]|uniref:Uncharacterized protein n=1 Tax=Lishizhenia tianjinensis TaxID=477690 RepID=A0A1I7A4I9_9FLAO|nr:hypothetical protein [Lishizhenia tianjinensis]SFT69805.1 hypothetical protein SAMN05216474_1885 [Lishizhenia tianjinensis]